MKPQNPALPKPWVWVHDPVLELLGPGVHQAIKICMRDCDCNGPAGCNGKKVQALKA